MPGTLSVVGFAIMASLGVWYIAYAARTPLRYLYRDYREERSGKIVWFKLSQQQRPQEGRGEVTESVEKRETDRIKKFCQQLSMDQRDKVGRLGRPVASFVWVKSEDSLITLYAGITESHQDKLESLFNSLNYSGRKIKGSPPIPDTHGLMVAHRNYQNNLENIQEVPTEIGTIPQSMGDDSIPPCAMILTLEPARDSEMTRYTRNLAESKLMRQGDTGAYGGATSKNADIASNFLMRGSMGVVAASGNAAESSRILKTLGEISSLSTKVNPRSITGQQILPSLSIAALGIAVTFGLYSISMIGGLAAIASCAVFGAGAAMTLGRVGQKQIEERAAKGEVVVPNFWWFSFRYTATAIFNSMRTNGAGGQAVGNRIAPPSIPQVIHFYSSPLAEFIAPPTSRSGSLNVSMEQVAKADLRQNFSDHGRFDIPLGLSYYSLAPAAFPIDTLELGAVFMGAPQSGKTNLLEVIWTSVCVGTYLKWDDLTISPTWFETKGEGAYAAIKQARLAYSAVKHLAPDAKEPLLLEAHNGESPYRVSFEGRRVHRTDVGVDDVYADIMRFYEALSFAFGSAIQHRSAEFLKSSLLIIGLLMPDEIDKIFNADETHTGEDVMDPYFPNYMSGAWRVLGGANETVPVMSRLREYGVNLKSEMTDFRREWERNGRPAMSDEEMREGTRRTTLIEHLEILDPLFSGDRQAKNDSAAPKNKLSPFMAAKSMFQHSEGRQEMTPEMIVTSNRPVVVNFGPYSYTDEEGNPASKRVLNGEDSQTLGLMFHSLMWSTVKNIGTGWAKQGKRVPIFADEVADLAADSDGDASKSRNVLADGIKEGRSRGWAYFMAAQQPSQIPDSALLPMMSIRTKAFFQMPSATDAELVLREFGALDGSTGFQVRHIQGLPRGVCAIVLYDREHGMSPPFNMRVPRSDDWGRAIERTGSPMKALELYARGVEKKLRQD